MKQVISGFMNLFSGKALINSKETINIEAEEVTTEPEKCWCILINLQPSIV